MNSTPYPPRRSYDDPHLFSPIRFLPCPSRRRSPWRSRFKPQRDRPAVATARIELRDAVVNLERAQGDPLSGEKRHLTSGAAPGNRPHRLHSDLLRRSGRDRDCPTTDVLQGRKGVEVAQKGVSVSETSLNIAEIRLRNGGGTQLDLDEARTAFNEAQNNLRSSQDHAERCAQQLGEHLRSRVRSGGFGEHPGPITLCRFPNWSASLTPPNSTPTVLEAEQRPRPVTTQPQPLRPLLRLGVAN